MNNLNSVLLEGNLSCDPKYQETSKGTPLCVFSMATNRYYRQGEELQKEVSFVDVETWAKAATMTKNLGHKGRGVRVVGRLKQDRWTDAEGKNRSRLYIVAEHLEFRPEFKSGASAEAEAEAGTAETEAEPEEQAEEENAGAETSGGEMFEPAF